MADEKKPEPPAAKPVRRSALPVITQNRLFASLIVIVASAFALSLVGLGVLALAGREPPTALQLKFAEACDLVVKVTLGALVGLLGGRAGTGQGWDIAKKS